MIGKDRIYNAHVRTTCVATMLNGAPQDMRAARGRSESSLDCMSRRGRHGSTAFGPSREVFDLEVSASLR